jgi:hypothetical protein
MKPRKKTGEKWGLIFTDKELKQRSSYIIHKKKYINSLIWILCQQRYEEPVMSFTVKEIKTIFDEYHAKDGHPEIKIPLSTLYRNLKWLYDNQYIVTHKKRELTNTGAVTLIGCRADYAKCANMERTQKHNKS